MTDDVAILGLVLTSLLIGWVFGRWRYLSKRPKNKQADNLSEKYAKGLNYLLTDDSDNAIRIFTDLIEVNKDTIEIHIALGNLFRSKGEVDRAIKVHQNLLARPNLSKQQRHMAIAELASDYWKAGWLDRAEKLYLEMIELKADVRQAYRRLLDLYITEKSWREAANCAEKLHEMNEPGSNVELAQCLCEVAQVALETSHNSRLARKSLDRALEVDPACVRAGLLLIDMELAADKRQAAKKVFQRLLKQNPEYISLYLQPARDIFLQSEPKVYLKFLLEQYEQRASTALAMAILEYYVDNGHTADAQQFLANILEQTPSFEAFEFAIKFLRSDPVSLGGTWDNLLEFLHTSRAGKSEYSCTRCGYESKNMNWLCPSCKGWSTMRMV